MVVPLQVVIGAQVHDEGSEGATPELVAQALRDFVPVSTSRPAPAALVEVYERLAREGAEEIVSIHLSGEMSGTFESAQLAARQVDVTVHCVDSRQVGVATGFAALSAVEAIRSGATGAEAAEVARAARCRGVLPVLRRHAGVPAAWRAHRRGRGHPRRRPRGQAAAVHRATARSPTSSGSGPPHAPSTGWRTSRSRPPGSARRRLRGAPGQPRAGRRPRGQARPATHRPAGGSRGLVRRAGRGPRRPRRSRHGRGVRGPTLRVRSGHLGVRTTQRPGALARGSSPQARMRWWRWSVPLPRFDACHAVPPHPSTPRPSRGASRR